MLRRRTFITHFSLVGGLLSTTGYKPGILRAQSPVAVINKIGIVIAVDQNVIYLNGSDSPSTIKVNLSTDIWKGESGLSISVIHPQDEISVRGIMDTEGALIASDIWVNIASFSGVIGVVNGDTVQVQVPIGDSGMETKVVRLTNKTRSTQTILLKKDNVQAGRTVRIIGTALEDGTIQASVFVVYDNGRPVDFVGTKYVDPRSGKIIDRP